MHITILVENSEGARGCKAAHGLSIYIETAHHKLLVDAGPDEELIINNAIALNVDLAQVDTVVLSHGHFDHSGGLMAFAGVNSHAPIYLQKNADRYYFGMDKQDYIGIDTKIMDLPQVVRLDGDCRIDEELFVFSHITGRRLWPQSNLVLKCLVNGEFIQDDFSHEQCLVITEGEKHVLISGCAHNGILNILDRYHEIYGAYPDVVLTGFHMMKRNAPYTEEEIETIRLTANELKNMPTLFYSGHCTGQPAFDIMKEILGDQLEAMYTGKRITVE